MPHPFKLGRKPRAFDPAIPHLSAQMANTRHLLPPPAPSADYLSALPVDVNMMLNDQLGDCTCAAIYHAIQIWTQACSKLQTNPDLDVLRTYESFCGYVDGDPSTDQGGIEQDVLRDWMHYGVPVISGTSPNKLAAWMEVDPRRNDDIKRVIADCGVCYIGFSLPDNILPADGSDPPMLWQVQPGAQEIGGHAVVLGKYDSSTVGLISWGNSRYEMTWDFFNKYVDEAYALVDLDWATKTGKTPLGMDLGTLVRLMGAMRFK